MQKEGDVIHVIAKSCHDLTRYLRDLMAERKEDLPLLTLARADERGPNQDDKQSFVPSARNFK